MAEKSQDPPAVTPQSAPSPAAASPKAEVEAEAEGHTPAPAPAPEPAPEPAVDSTVAPVEYVAGQPPAPLPAAASVPAQHIPVDDQYEVDDSDSAVDAGSVYSDTTSLYSDILKYRFEHGRRYHGYKDGEYWGPNDEKQNNQLDLAHHMYLLTMGGKLFLAPIGDNPQQVLDVGTGTGIWAMDFADQYPSSQVTGFDLSPIQPAWVAPNVRFEINDACEEDWGYKKNSFDFIHVRGMYGSVADWPAFYQQALAHLAPGGWYQQIEMSVVPTSDDGSVTEGSIFDQWGKVSLEAGDKFGKDLRIHKQIKGYLEDAGFEGVVEHVFKWPIGPWSKDPTLKEIGQWNQLHWLEGIEGWSLALLTRVLGWSYEAVQVYLANMREGLKDRKVHAYHVINVVYGQKPRI